jgi:hypothetical protein
MQTYSENDVLLNTDIICQIATSAKLSLHKKIKQSFFTTLSLLSINRYYRSLLNGHLCLNLSVIFEYPKAVSISKLVKYATFDENAREVHIYIKDDLESFLRLNIPFKDSPFRYHSIKICEYILKKIVERQDDYSLSNRTDPSNLFLLLQKCLITALSTDDLFLINLILSCIKNKLYKNSFQGIESCIHGYLMRNCNSIASAKIMMKYLTVDFEMIVSTLRKASYSKSFKYVIYLLKLIPPFEKSVTLEDEGSRMLRRFFLKKTINFERMSDYEFMINTLSTMKVRVEDSLIDHLYKLKLYSLADLLVLLPFDHHNSHYAHYASIYDFVHKIESGKDVGQFEVNRWRSGSIIEASIKTNSLKTLTKLLEFSDPSEYNSIKEKVIELCGSIRDDTSRSQFISFLENWNIYNNSVL